MIPFKHYYENSIEFYYTRSFKKNHLIQYKLFRDHNLGDDFLNCLDFKERSSLIDEYEDNYGLYEITDYFKYLNLSPFQDFFYENSIDIPKCFLKSKSLVRNTPDKVFYKLVNYIMRHGLRYKILKNLNNFIFKNGQFLYLNTNPSFFIKPIMWKYVYTIYSHHFIKLNSPNFYKIQNTYYEPLNYKNVQDIDSKKIVNTFDFKHMFFKSLEKFCPIFCFYIYKVDKGIFKNSRGKSGKYLFIWKYISSYKRLNLVMFWLARELKIIVGKSLIFRLESFFKLLLKSPLDMWIYKIKKFSHNYVFRNCKNTLCEDYITVLK